MKAGGQGRWSSRSLGSRFKHEIFYRLIRLAGPAPAYVLLYVVVFYYSLCPGVVRRSRPYLRRRFPAAGFFGLWRHAFRLNLSFGLALLERAIMGLGGQMEFEAPEETKSLIEELLNEGRGLVVLTAHVGAWQTGMGWLMQKRRPVNIVSRREPGDVDLHYFEHQGQEASRPKLIDPAEPAAAMAAMTAALLAGEIVCLMGDRVRPGDSLVVPVSFLGAEIPVPGAPFFLAARLGTPVAVVFTRRLGPLRVTGEAALVIRPPQAGRAARTDGALAPPAAAFAGALEQFVLAHPYQFFNFYDLWSA
ncbi:MAG: lipid A biosynthesis acyltransferase [Candidatus Adiutrix sp.]|jgi:predicted LPLAT superfamily acyltransferase|nr:lipid A biosynthesis acyltransferase [Candidatus Adiutrix sp.]